MACCHVAHDCRTGDGVTIANGALLAGCVTLGARVFVSGNVTIHQFVRVGELAMIGGLSRVSKDVPPYMLVVGDSKVCGVNVIGMRRASMTAEASAGAVRRAYGILYRSGLAMSRAVERLRDETPSAVVDAILALHRDLDAWPLRAAADAPVGAVETEAPPLPECTRGRALRT